MLRLLGYGASEPAKPAPQRGLAASWYRSPAMYQLERRAIFSQRWILVTHSLRFGQAGDYAAFTFANFGFFLVRDRTGHKINGFHNICRHRAYPVVDQACGTARVLSCQYHGWSYGLHGDLAKAPRFDTVAGFDKRQHGLWPVHVHVDKAGFVWVNLEATAPAGTAPSVAWADQLGDVDESERMRQFDFAQEFAYDHAWALDVDANWKGLIENYNECYHCPTAHPLIAGVSDVAQYRVEPTRDGGVYEHTIVNKDPAAKQFRRTIVYFYPGTSVTITDHMFYIQRMVPVTATTSKVENEVYRHKDATDDEFAKINDFYHQVLAEDKELCDGAQRNINSGVYVNGEFHPDKEKVWNNATRCCLLLFILTRILQGPLHFQETVRKDAMGHRKKEEAQGGREIWPATPKAAGEMKTGKLDEEEAFCSKLESETCLGSRPELAW